MSLRLAALFALASAGCADGGRTPLRPPPPEPIVPLSPADSATRFAELCADCHGEIGEGGLGPRLIDLDMGHDELSQTIDRTMPENDPALCEDGCAEGIATFIRERLTSDALRCDAVPPSVRRLRLLNRREYGNSVRDLLGLTESAAGPSCEPTLFRYDPGARSPSAVSVAGSFNGWDASAWPMELSGGIWTLTRALPVGTHEYKLVLDGSEWISDPSNPEGVDDGFGGRNSLVHVECDASAAPPSELLDLTADLPIEPRPEGYVFDNSADALRVTSVHLDELLRAAERALTTLGPDGLDALVACTAGRAVCTPAFVRGLGRRTFRRPLSESEASRYESLAAEAPDDRSGYRAVVLGMLVSPHFLYRSELGDAQPDGTFALNGYEIASALSYGIVGTTPSDALLDAAARGELDETAGIESHARALLDDPNAREVIASFGRQWLGIEGVPDATKVDPSFDPLLGSAMVEETEAFLLHVVFEGSGRFEELLSADYTFVNARLAALYGMEGVSGDALRRASYPDAQRAGVLAHASVLSATAHSDQSSPIRRGLFVRQRLLCQSFPAPPPSAGGVPDVDPDATTRERFGQHTDDAFCAGCHRYIDPVGFGFEPFGPIGAWREFENGHPVEVGGNMLDVEYLGADTDAPFDTLPELAAVLVESDAAPACFARHAYRFVRGAEETIEERCAVEHVTERFRESGGDVRELFVSTFTSPDFRLRRQP